MVPLPCSEALVRAGVKKVFARIIDPYHKVNGEGIEYLKKHGIESEVGFYEEEIKEDLKEFLERINAGKQD